MSYIFQCLLVPLPASELLEQLSEVDRDRPIEVVRVSDELSLAVLDEPRDEAFRSQALADAARRVSLDDSPIAWLLWDDRGGHREGHVFAGGVIVASFEAEDERYAFLDDRGDPVTDSPLVREEDIPDDEDDYELVISAIDLTLERSGMSDIGGIVEIIRLACHTDSVGRLEATKAVGL